MAALSPVPTGNTLYLPLTPIGGGSKLITLTNAVAADQTPTALPVTLSNGLIADPNDLIADSDGDGIADSWEVSHGFDPLNAADAAQDADGDGCAARLILRRSPHHSKLKCYFAWL